MTSTELIGIAGTAYLQRSIRSDVPEEGTARFLLDRLTGPQIAAICRNIAARPALASQIQVRIPRELGVPEGLPEDVLTDERTTHWRNAECERPVLLIANTDDDQGQSLRDVTPVDSSVLCGDPDIWIDAAADGLGLTDRHVTVWKRAVKGLQEAKPVSLDTFAAYVLATRSAVADHGLPIVMALGWALPELRTPKHSAFFNAIREQSLTHASQWKRLYQQAFNRYAPYLLKFTSSQQPISGEQLREAWQRVSPDVPPQHHPVVEAFVAAPNKWTPQAEAISRLEWEQDNIHSLFDGLRAQRVPLGTATAQFFEDEFPDTLTDEEQQYLQRLDTRQTRDPNEEDEEFYERHRTELAGARTIKGKWDKFIFGQPIETDDFHVGVLRSLERLFEQIGSAAQNRTLRIESHRRSRGDWREMNTSAVTYFSRRYRGLHDLTRRDVTWDVGELFAFERVIEREQQRGRYQPNQSAAKAANQIKFYISLEAEGRESASTQLVWTFNPNSIRSQYTDDWARLLERPMVLSRVSREPVSKKGKLQAIDLEDVSTLEPVFRQERGSLIARYEPAADLARIVPERLEQAKRHRRITDEGYGSLVGAWQAFSQSYAEALRAAYEQGVSAPECLTIENTYRSLLEALLQHAPGDGNRKDIWEPILALGVTRVEGGTTSAIVAPWHPMRLLGMAAKTRQMVGLVKHLVNADTVDFGDARVFFQDLGDEAGHPYYPEVCVGMHGNQPTLLAWTDLSGDYTLMESPVVNYGDDDSTNENPTGTAIHLLKLVQEYLKLQPHEGANLAIVLYNCNSARLPQSVVNVLGGLYEDEEEVRCQVVLRHHSPPRLHELYEKLIESSDEGDNYIASEASRDFMARLRIGIMADSAPVPNAHDGPPEDIVFLQDVIARLAEQQWIADPTNLPTPELLHHFPPRWSRRRPATRDDLRSEVYLACPSQPQVGWLYLQAVHGFTRGIDATPADRYLPVRQISFQHNSVRDIFDETHRLGQWVVNFDDLLTKRQLRTQGVQVIRHRQQRYAGRGVTISSKAPLNLLDVMVQRRLNSLALGLDAEAVRGLTRRMIDEATEISGDIVLRAAKRGQFANELIGLVLSRFLLQDELGPAAYCGWYFLDDYAEWLGQKEEHLADILALSPRREGNDIVLVALLGEAKYLDSASLAKGRRVSAVQLRETMQRMQDALFGNPGRLDRNLWLARFADMIVDGIEVPATHGAALHEWRDAIRSGSARLLLKGYSHVFVHTQQPDERDASERVPLPPLTHAWQEVYGRERVRQLVLAYASGQSARTVRASLSDDTPWSVGQPTLPTRHISWTTVPRAGTSPRRGPQPPDGSDGSGNGGAPRPEVPPPSTPVGPQVVLPTPTPAAISTVEQGRVEPISEPQATPSISVSPTVERRVISGTSSNPAFAWAGPALRQTLASLAPLLAVQADDETWVRSTENKLRSALLSYNLQARVLGHRLTPNAALIRLQGSDRLRVSDIEQRRRELLTTHGLHVTSILAEPGQVAISVARPNRQVVSLVDVWRTRTIGATRGINQSIVIGVREADGETLYLRPGEVHAPHSLVAGTTGSGKSILIQNLLLDIAATNTTANAKIVLIDPKQGADYLDLQDLPHMEGGIIVTQEAAQAALESAVAEMDRRYGLFRQARVANLARFNAQAPPEQRLPVLWLVHDEFAVWMLTDTYKDIVANTVARLGVMARAAGIFLIFAAQRPEDRVMPLQLRDNLGNRLVLRVESPGTSVIALGEEGAERLLGKGHLAARLQGEDSIVLGQVPILGPEQIPMVVESIRNDGMEPGGSAS